MSSAFGPEAPSHTLHITPSTGRALLRLLWFVAATHRAQWLLFLNHPKLLLRIQSILLLSFLIPRTDACATLFLLSFYILGHQRLHSISPAQSFSVAWSKACTTLFPLPFPISRSRRLPSTPFRSLSIAWSEATTLSHLQARFFQSSWPLKEFICGLHLLNHPFE